MALRKEFTGLDSMSDCKERFDEGNNRNVELSIVNKIRFINQ